MPHGVECQPRHRPLFFTAAVALVKRQDRRKGERMGGYREVHVSGVRREQLDMALLTEALVVLVRAEVSAGQADDQSSKGAVSG